MIVDEEFRRTAEYRSASFWAVGFVMSTLAVLFTGTYVLAMGMANYGPAGYAWLMFKAMAIVWVVTGVFVVLRTKAFVDAYPEAFED